MKLRGAKEKDGFLAIATSFPIPETRSLRLINDLVTLEKETNDNDD